jgi:hypothetical protein
VVEVKMLPTVVGDRDPIMRAGRRAAVATVIGALVGLAVTSALYLGRPVQYASTVALELTSVAPLVDLNPTGPRLDDVTIDTDAVVTTADPVVDAVAAAVGSDPEDVRSALTVRARPLSRVLEVTYTTTASPDAAREGVTAAAEAYLDLREKLIIDPVRSYVSGVVKATDTVQSDSTIVGDQISRGQAGLELRLERAEAYEINLPLPGAVVASASSPTARRGVVDVALMSGAMLGALLGFVIGLGWERRASHRHRRGAA